MSRYNLGLDLGTKTIVLARRDEEGKPVFRHEINGFYEFEKPDQFTKKLLVKQNVPYLERDGKIYALGEAAEQLAYAFNNTLRRPMADGIVSKEQEAINIMASIVHAIIGKIDRETILYYCIPANAINKDTNISLHQKIAQMIIELKKSEAPLHAFHINEARAIAVANEDATAVAISWGAGMVNVCYTQFGIPIFEFSVVGSGDWIDLETARAFGYDSNIPDKKYPETPTTVCRVKQSIDLTKDVNSLNRVEQVIALNYRILIENVINGIISGFNRNIDKARIDNPIPIIMAGGTASPNGFVEYFRSILNKQQLPFKVASVKVHSRPLYTVAEGCLKASELHE